MYTRTCFESNYKQDLNISPVNVKQDSRFNYFHRVRRHLSTYCQEKHKRLPQTLRTASNAPLKYFNLLECSVVQLVNTGQALRRAPSSSPTKLHGVTPPTRLVTYYEIRGFQQWRTQEFGGGGFQQIQLTTENRENGDLGAVAPSQKF